MVEARIKVEQNSQLSISNISCPSSHVPCFGRRMKQNMTEVQIIFQLLKSWVLDWRLIFLLHRPRGKQEEYIEF